MDLDDGVMVNSAALWPLLEPQWKDPKKWWKELANAAGKKDYDWSHLAARYFPKRVRAEVRRPTPRSPSPTSASGSCTPRRPTRGSCACRTRSAPTSLSTSPTRTRLGPCSSPTTPPRPRDILAKELKRREKKTAKADADDDAGPLFEGADDEEQEAADA